MPLLRAPLGYHHSSPDLKVRAQPSYKGSSLQALWLKISYHPIPQDYMWRLKRRQTSKRKALLFRFTMTERSNRLIIAHEAFSLLSVKNHVFKLRGVKGHAGCCTCSCKPTQCIQKDANRDETLRCPDQIPSSPPTESSRSCPWAPWACTGNEINVVPRMWTKLSLWLYRTSLESDPSSTYLQKLQFGLKVPETMKSHFLNFTN